MPLTDCLAEGQRSDAPGQSLYWLVKFSRFSVAAIFLVLLSCAVYRVRNGVPEPIRWKVYSEEKRDSALAAGKTVLVLLYSEYASESELALRKLDCNCATKLCKCTDFEPLLLRHRWEGHDIKSIWKQVGHSKYPMLVIYSPNKPPVSYNPLADADLG
jgi:hypothetical protein